MHPETVAWFVIPIFLFIPVLLVSLFYLITERDLGAALELATMTIILVVMGGFIGGIIMIAMSLIYVFLGAIGLDGLWTFYFEQIIAENGLVGMTFVSVIVLSGVSAYLAPIVLQERKEKNSVKKSPTLDR